MGPSNSAHCGEFIRWPVWTCRVLRSHLEWDWFTMPRPWLKQTIAYRSVLSKWEFFIKMRAAFLLSPSCITQRTPSCAVNENTRELRLPETCCATWQPLKDEKETKPKLKCHQVIKWLVWVDCRGGAQSLFSFFHHADDDKTRHLSRDARNQPIFPVCDLRLGSQRT